MPPPAAQLERLRTFLEPSSPAATTRPARGCATSSSSSSSRRATRRRGRFVAELTLDPPSSTGDLAGPPLLDEDYLVLSTIHSAKGCEWDVVHVIHAADGMIPSDMATGDDEQIEEERRLLYVALTRARDALHVSFPQRYYRRPRGLEDPHSYAQLTRFLPDGVRAHFDEVGPDVLPLPEPGERDRRNGRRRRVPGRTLVRVTPVPFGACLSPSTSSCWTSTTRSCGANGARSAT